MIDRMQRGHAAGAYRDQEIQTADSVQLVVKTYEILAHSIARARAAAASGAWREKGEEVARATRAIGSLQSALDRDRGGDVARNLDRLYGWFQLRLAQAHAENSDEKFGEVADQVAELLAAWRTAQAGRTTAASADGAAARPATSGTIGAPR